MSGPTVTIENRRPLPTVLNLHYREAKDPTLAVRQKRAKLVKGKDGWRRLRVEHARLSESLSLRPRGKEGSAEFGLPPSVANCQDVIDKEQKRWIKVIHVTEADTEKQAAERAAAAKQRAEAHERMMTRLAERRKKAPEAAKPPKPTRRKARRPAAGSQE